MKIQRLILASVLAAFACASARAAQVDYADVDADSMMFIEIGEDTTTDGPLFGQPTHGGGDRLDFNPVMFEATASDGSEIVDSQLSFTVMSKPGEAISNITFTESGDYQLAGVGAAMASAEVSSNIFWEVVEIDGSSVAPITGSVEMVFSPSDGDYELGTDPNSSAWNGFVDVDVAGFLSGEGVAGNATKVEFTLDNTLLVSAGGGGSALIKKKDFDGLVINIPEPSGGLLLIVGLLGLVRRRR